MKSTTSSLLINSIKHVQRCARLFDKLKEGQTYKAVYLRNTSNVDGLQEVDYDRLEKFPRPIKIIKKYPRFALVEHRNGYREALTPHELRYLMPDGAELWH
jgi:hypothetical protein